MPSTFLITPDGPVIFPDTEAPEMVTVEFLSATMSVIVCLSPGWREFLPRWTEIDNGLMLLSLLILFAFLETLASWETGLVWAVVEVELAVVESKTSCCYRWRRSRWYLLLLAVAVVSSSNISRRYPSYIYAIMRQQVRTIGTWKFRSYLIRPRLNLSICRRESKVPFRKVSLSRSTISWCIMIGVDAIYLNRNLAVRTCSII